jgi:[acyl-carrier-protein] S-malonyltransferase
MTALLFPGQGSQQAGMRELVEANRPHLLDLALDVVGADPFARIQDGTAYLQPAIYCASIACLRGAPPVDAAAYAGHSLGEVAALVAAGSLDEEDGLVVVAERGRLMQRAATEQPGGAMLAVGASPEAAAELAGAHGLTVANDNCPGQMVLSGEGEAIGRARAAAKSLGLRASRLPIKGAFHSAAMEPIVDEFRDVLARVGVRPPARPTFSCVSAAEFQDADDVRRLLADSLTHGVRWREVLLAMHERGVRRFVEVGPGEVLAKLTAATLPDAASHTLRDLEGARG